MNNNDINSSKENSFLTRGCKCNPIQNDEKKVYNKMYCKLSDFDWLEKINLPPNSKPFDCVEVRFKNSHKDFYRIKNSLDISIGDIVAVESLPGHDIGIISLTGESARLQMNRKNVDPASKDIKALYRRARISDIEKWVIAINQENKILQKTKKITNDLKLGMKMNDVEYQGDGTKAVFYYTAEERIDFRELIKILAEEFKIRIEMRQIGVRQEAARLGGIGSCGRELCCASWMHKFYSVTTYSARIQQLSLNPQKLAGHCAKLKCCLNFERDVYADALKDFPDHTIPLKTKKGTAIFQKFDVFKNIMWYAYENEPFNMMSLSAKNVKQILDMNKQEKFPEKLEDFVFSISVNEPKMEFENATGQEDLFRFDKKKKNSN